MASLDRVGGVRSAGPPSLDSGAPLLERDVRKGRSAHSPSNSAHSARSGYSSDSGRHPSDRAHHDRVDEVLRTGDSFVGVSSSQGEWEGRGGGRRGRLCSPDLVALFVVFVGNGLVSSIQLAYSVHMASNVLKEGGMVMFLDAMSYLVNIVCHIWTVKFGTDEQTIARVRALSAMVSVATLLGVTAYIVWNAFDEWNKNKEASFDHIALMTFAWVGLLVDACSISIFFFDIGCGCGEERGSVRGDGSVGRGRVGSSRKSCSANRCFIRTRVFDTNDVNLLSAFVRNVIDGGRGLCLIMVAFLVVFKVGAAGHIDSISTWVMAVFSIVGSVVLIVMTVRVLLYGNTIAGEGGGGAGDGGGRKKNRVVVGGERKTKVERV